MFTKIWVCFCCEKICLNRFLCHARREAPQLAGVHWKTIYSPYHCILIPMFSHSEVPIALQIMADAWCSDPRVTLSKKRTAEIGDLHWMSWLYFVLFGKYQEWVSQGCLYFQQWFSYCRKKKSNQQLLGEDSLGWKSFAMNYPVWALRYEGESHIVSLALIISRTRRWL